MTQPPHTPALMFQGTGSDVGKSLLVAGLGRAFTRRGLTVRPFKPQNMSNNAAVTADGGEIGRAQALQARACRAPLTTDLNPVLLKPQTDIGAQVVVQGRVWGNAGARDYQALRPKLLPAVLESYARLAAEADLVLVEGAGSAAEVNLRAGDIANMGFATAAGLPVVLVGDIDKGGVIASLVGTHTLLPAAERALLAGFIVNKFRGDISLFDGGLKIIYERTGLVSFGVVPWFPAARRLPAEDAVALDRPRERLSPAVGGLILGGLRPPLATRQAQDEGGSVPDFPHPELVEGEGNPRASAPIRIAVPVLSRIANFDDLDPLIAEPDVAVDFVPAGRALPGDADLVVLPGSKATLADLAFLRAQGWDIDIAAHVRRGGLVVGLCGGYQMLGRRIADPQGIEGAAGEAAGLGLLELETSLTGHKTLVEAAGVELASGQAVRGYEMHVGATEGPALGRPLLRLGRAPGRPEGAVSADGRIMGCYLHGLFAADGFRQAFLGRIRARRASGLAYESEVEATLDALAAHLEAHLDLDRLLAAARAKLAERRSTRGPSRAVPIT